MFKSVLCLKLKIFTKKSVGLEKLANGRCVFEVQRAGTMVVDRVKEYNPYVFLLIFSLIFMANAKATTRQSTTFFRYLMTLLMSDVW